MSWNHASHAGFGGLPLAALRAFEAAARRGSFQAGAAEIGLTPSAVSHHVRGLEATLGLPLFRRLHRGVALTPTGASLAAALAEGFGAIAAAYAAARAPRGVLSVSAAPVFAGRWLLPAMEALRREGIELRVELSSRAADLDSGACDVAIRMGRRPPAPLVAERLASTTAVLLAAPSRMAGRAALTPEEIAEGPLLGIKLIGEFWPRTLARLGIPAAPRREILSDSMEAALRMAEGGFGIGFAPEVAVQDRIAVGTLCLAHPRRFGGNGQYYWFVTRPEAVAQPAIRRLRDWLQEALASAG
ncbi:LysR family transcriptional regulator [Belnapia sp. T6]|uniref:LysR family transcriptional regulator n=1 Tax=Belnapia mucosa TaxID=2804532 RepID=A0ABS1V3S1_9PROT|nr:LysR substrate-binding domain-containing protein [Belnapia mucosa]MBL6455902.1 LysR family transcriptional regulator [Belnapia mucosa]